MDLQKSFSRIVSLLALPSVIIASLWLWSIHTRLQEAQTASEALVLIGEIWPVSTTGNIEISAFSIDDLSGKATWLHPQQRMALRILLDDARSTNLTTRKLHASMMAVRSISDAIKVKSALGSDATVYLRLITDRLPNDLIRAQRFAQTAQRLSPRENKQHRDYMAGAVAGGVYKASSDSTLREIRLLQSASVKAISPAIGDNAKAYRTANLAVQEVGSTFILALLAESANLTETAANLATQSSLLQVASGTLWRDTYDLIVKEIETTQNQLLIVFITSLIGVAAMLLAAVVMAVSMSRRLAEKTANEFARLGMYDPLTQLPNRRAMAAHLTEFIDKRQSAGWTQADGIIYFDLLDFRALNDRFGDAAGDKILQKTAMRLSEKIGKSGFLARTGSDEFAVLLDGTLSNKPAEELAHDLMRKIARPTTIDGERIEVAAHAGVVELCKNSASSDHCIKDAELALREAKGQAAGAVCRFDQVMRQRFDDAFAMAGEIKNALSEDRIVPWFQPQICLHTGRLIGVEALARWVTADGRVLGPGAFLPAAETAGLRPAIDVAIRRHAFASMRTWLDQGLPINRCGINLAAEELQDPEFKDTLHAEIAEAGISLEHIGIEILESVAVDGRGSAGIVRNVAELVDLGAFIELDDFGTGHAGLSSLRQLQINMVKIDRSFVQDVDSNPELQTLTRALIGLAKTLDIKVLAEGVETEAERQWLKAQGCDAIQGFLLAKPMASADLVHWVQLHHLAENLTLV